MRHLVRVALFLSLIAGSGVLVPAAGAASAPLPGPCRTSTLPHGALALACVPASGWNGDLVVFAHGYTAFNQPLAFQNLTLPDGTTSLPTLAQSLGFAFATTSYRENGLAILPGLDDIRELVAAFRAAHGIPAHTYLVGASEGGLITTLLVERSPRLFSGGLAACGPIGDFRQQIDYIGDFRVLFDYFFPGVLPGSPIDVPRALIDQWDQTYVPAIRAALAANPSAAQQLIATAKAAIDPADPTSIVTTTLDVLWYAVFSADDASRKLGGNPYGNRDRWYWGSSDDLRLNLGVRRFTADARAVANLAPYQTTGAVTIPLVTVHTTGDDVIPFWNELLYAGKAHPSGHGSVVQLPIFRYRHCNFTTTDLLFGFGLLVWQASAQTLPGGAPAAGLQQAQRDFDRANATAQRPAAAPPGPSAS